jgi:hypothetical protein
MSSGVGALLAASRGGREVVHRGSIVDGGGGASVCGPLAATTIHHTGQTLLHVCKFIENALHCRIHGR